MSSNTERLRRREALKAMGLTLGAGLLAACSGARPTTTPTSRPLPTMDAENFGKEKTATPTVVVSPVASPTPTGPKMINAETSLRIDFADQPSFQFFGAEAKIYNGYYQMTRVYRQQGEQNLGPIEAVQFAYSFNRGDYVGIDLNPYPHSIPVLPIQESYPTETGEKRDFRGKLTVFRHIGDDLSVVEYLTEDNWSYGPIGYENPAYIWINNTWGIRRGSAYRIGRTHIALEQGSAKEGNIAYLYQKYAIKGQ